MLFCGCLPTWVSPFTCFLFTPFLTLSFFLCFPHLSHVSTSLSFTNTCQCLLLAFCRNTYAVISLKPHGVLQTRHTQHVGEACGKCIHKGVSHSFLTVSGQIHHSLIKLKTGYASMQGSSWVCSAGVTLDSQAEQNKGLIFHIHMSLGSKRFTWLECDLLLSQVIPFNPKGFTL